MNMYFIAIVLPGELDKKVLKYKEHMYNTYGATVGLKSPAHITLVPPFWMDGLKEEELTRDIEALHDFPPFALRTCNFSAFRPRTIFIALQPNEVLNLLKKRV